MSKQNDEEPKRVDEQPRFLHRQSQHGYTSNPAMALHAEPEAVSAEYQRQLAHEARMRRAIDRQLLWRAEKAKIIPASRRSEPSPMAATGRAAASAPWSAS